MRRSPSKRQAGKADGTPLPLDTRRRLRMRLVLWMLLAGFGAVLFRLYDVQLSPGFPVSEHTGWRPIVIPRGRIFDRNGLILARDQLAPSLWADPRKVGNPRQVAARLSDLLGVDQELTFRRLTREADSGGKMKFVWIKRWLSDEELARVEPLLEGQGLEIKREYARAYPENSLGAQVIGFINQEGAGEGVEAAFNEHLRSTPGEYVAQVDAHHRFLPWQTLRVEPARGGADVFLTLSKPIQYTLERELAAAMERTGAPRAMGLVMEPNSGAILALASLPSFDPNRYFDYNAEERKNRAVVDVFEPGSSFKIVTAAAALEEGLVTPDTPIDCEGGSFNPYGHRITDYHRHDFEPDIVPFKRAFAESSNVAIIKVASLLEPERLAEWIRAFGFGARTSEDLPAESPGIFRPVSQWSRLSMGSLPMGQEIAVTMPQLAVAYAAIANGGIRVEPHLVGRAVDREESVTYRFKPKRVKRILSEDTARTMRELCHAVVTDEHGTGWRANIAEYRVGGKTGTAQMANPDGGGYYDDKYTAVFAGFAPLADPRVVAVLVVQEPEIGKHYGSIACAPAFRNVVRETLILMHCPPDPVRVPVREERGAAPVVRVAKEDDPGAGDPDTASPPPAEAVREPTDAEILARLDGLELISRAMDREEKGPRLPDLAGMTKRQARERLAELGLNWDAQGSGWVVSQDPEPGTPLAHVTLCRLVFEARSSHEDNEKPDETS